MVSWILRQLSDIGISQAGFCPYESVLPLREVRSSSRLPPDPRWVIFCLFPYYTGDFPGRNISLYAVPDDYHTIAGGMLEQAAGRFSSRWPDYSFVPFVDSSPIREVYGACLAGLGIRGKNGLLINPVFGSRVFIGEIVTDLPLDPPPPPMAEDACGSCDACLRLCPEGALSAEGFSMGLCRSHVSQKKGELSPFEKDQLVKGGLVWGCDICTDVCPKNKRARLSDIPAFYENLSPTVTLENCERLLERKSFGYRGLGTIRRNLLLLEKPFQLVRPSAGHQRQYEEMMAEWESFGGRLNPGALRRYSHSQKRVVSYQEWLQWIESDRQAGQELFFFMKGDFLLGAISLRPKISGEKRYLDGHIGYGIRPSERRKGYGAKMLSLALPILFGYGVDPIIITCSKDNTGSAKVMEKNGGTFLREAVDEDGDHLKVYQFNRKGELRG